MKPVENDHHPLSYDALKFAGFASRMNANTIQVFGGSLGGSLGGIGASTADKKILELFHGDMASLHDELYGGDELYSGDETDQSSMEEIILDDMTDEELSADNPPTDDNPLRKKPLDVFPNDTLDINDALAPSEETPEDTLAPIINLADALTEDNIDEFAGGNDLDITSVLGHGGYYETA